MRTVSTLAELKAIYAEYCNGPRTEIAKSIPDVRFSKLTGEDKTVLSSYVATETLVCLVDFNNVELIDFVLGLAESDGTLPIFATVDGKAYHATRNQFNRSKTDSRIGPKTKDGTYSNSMVRGHWICNWNDPGLVCWLGGIRSFQHRLGAMKLALPEMQANGTLLPLFPMVFGIPPQFSDMTDKAKSRSAKDDDSCDPSVVPLDLIRSIQTEIHGEPMETNDLVPVRKDCIALRLKLLGCLSQRLRGSDVSKTGDKLTDDMKNDLLDRLGGGSVVDDFIIRVYESQRSPSGKLDRQWTDLFSPAIVATGLVLYNSGFSKMETYVAETVQRQPDETAEEYTERRLDAQRAFIAGPLKLDIGMVQTFLTTLMESTAENGEFSTIFADLYKRKGNEKKGSGSKNLFFEPLSKPSMSAFVKLMKAYESNELSVSVWTTYKNIGTADKPEFSPKYECFGGVDCGHKSKSEE